MKLKDLLKGRDKLREYDELKEWRERFRNPTAKLEIDILQCSGLIKCQECFRDVIPGHIKLIILNAINAEIKKMEEE